MLILTFVSVIGQFFYYFFSSSWTVLFCIPVNFLLGTRYFTSLGAIYFYITIHILELCYGCIWLIWKQIDPFRLCCLDLLSRTRAVQFRANYFPLPRQDPSEYSAQCPVNHEVFQFGWWKGTNLGPVWETGSVFWVILTGSFPGTG